MNRSRDDYVATQQSNKQTLQEIVNQISNLEMKIPELNKQVCDGDTSVDNPCDSLCGGAGCGKCGGISCLNGALSITLVCRVVGNKKRVLTNELKRFTISKS